jgi:hypothetical protein
VVPKHRGKNSGRGTRRVIERAGERKHTNINTTKVVDIKHSRDSRQIEK